MSVKKVLQSRMDFIYSVQGILLIRQIFDFRSVICFAYQIQFCDQFEMRFLLVMNQSGARFDVRLEGLESFLFRRLTVTFEQAKDTIISTSDTNTKLILGEARQFVAIWRSLYVLSAHCKICLIKIDSP